MAGYTRQSTFADGDTITAALFNNEYNQLLNAFSNTGGHKHDGTANEGPVIGLIGDAGETAPNNKVLIDTTNNYIEFYVEVSSAPVQQLYIADGAIIPVTDSDVDLGTTSLRFKDTYTDTITTTGNATIGGDLTVTGSATISGNLTFGDADTDCINLAAEIDSDIIPNTDGTYDLGSATKEWQDLYIDGTANIDSLVADTADINGGTIDGATIATSDITVGAGKTLDVSSGTLTLADDQISGDKVEGGTIAATTVTTLTSTTGNITNVNSTTTNATTVDSTNLEVTNLKAKDGTAAGSIADSTGVVTLASSVLTTTDINGGTIDDSTIATSDITVGTGKTLDVSAGTLTLADNQISGDKVEGGTIAATTITDLTFGSLNDGTITVTAFADEDDMSSDSATLVPTQQSVKAYVDSQVTAQDLDFQGDTGGALSIDLDSESLTIAGGTGLDTVGSGNTVTVNIDSTVTTLTGSQTLTNKTIDVDNNTVSNIEVDNFKASAIVLESEGIGSNDNDTSLPTSAAVKDYVDTQITAEDLDITTDSGTIAIDLDSETLTVSGGTGLDSSATGNAVTLAIDSTVATLTGTQTLTNKTLTSPVINTGVSGTAFLDDDTFATATASTLASSESIKAYVDTTVAATNEVVEDTTPQLGGDLDLNSNDIIGTGNINNTGTITTDGLTVDGGTGTIRLGNGDSTITNGDTIGKLEFYSSDSSTNASGVTFEISNVSTDAAWDGGGNTHTTYFYSYGDASNPVGTATAKTRLSIDNSIGDISFYEDTGTTAQMTWDASADALTFTDNTKATFGTGSDLEVYHDGFVAWFDNTDSVTKDTQIKVADGGYITLKAGAKSMIQAAGNFNVSLYYDGSPKLATTNTGIDVTGTATMDGLTVEDGGTIQLTKNTVSAGDSLGIIEFHDEDGAATADSGKFQLQAFRGADKDAPDFKLIGSDAGGTLRTRLQIADSGNISFYDDTGTSQALYWDASAERLGIGTSSPSAPLTVNTGSDGNNVYIDNNGTQLAIGSTSSVNYINTQNGSAKLAIQTNCC